MNQQEIVNFLSTQSNIFEILRENDFKYAKMFFSELEIRNEYKGDRGIDVIERRPAWQYYLREMIISEDPLAYMKNFIKENNE